MNEHFFEERGIAYRTNAFKPARPTLVFIHGLSGSSSAWALYEKHFELSYNILTYDIRGHGLSQRPPHLRDYALSSYIEDLDRLLRHCNITTCVLIAHSFATLFAIEYVARNSQVASACVLISPAVQTGRRFAERVLKIALALSPVLQYFPLPMPRGGRVDYVRYQQRSEYDIVAISRDLRTTGFRMYCYAAFNMLGLDVRNKLLMLQMPLLLIHGTRDGYFPFENSEIIRTILPHAQLVAIEGADHILVHNYIPQLCAAIDTFLAAHHMTGNPPKSSF